MCAGAFLIAFTYTLWYRFLLDIAWLVSRFLLLILMKSDRKVCTASNGPNTSIFSRVHEAVHEIRDKNPDRLHFGQDKTNNLIHLPIPTREIGLKSLVTCIVSFPHPKRDQCALMMDRDFYTKCIFSFGINTGVRWEHAATIDDTFRMVSATSTNLVCCKENSSSNSVKYPYLH